MFDEFCSDERLFFFIFFYFVFSFLDVLFGVIQLKFCCLYYVNGFDDLVDMDLWLVSTSIRSVLGI